MRVVFPALVACLVLSACGPVATYYREGASVSRLYSDQTQCEIQALRDAPVANQVRQRPPIYIPGERICNAAGNCVTRPGYWRDGEIYTVDVNQDLRGRVQSACMTKRGYTQISLPRCTQGTPVALSNALPPLGETSCVIINSDGTQRVVTP